VGSYAELAEYKAQTLNRFVQAHGIKSVVEFGCGDGTQLTLYRFPEYFGLDVSSTAVRRCRALFKDDLSKRFEVYTPDLPALRTVPIADLALSIDVLYHLVEESVLRSYLRDLFAAAGKFVIIYSTNFERLHNTPHQRDRNFTSTVRTLLSDFELVETILNPYKGEDTMSDFFVYRRSSK
jgi:SAM-dependent methyltransferase